MSACPRCGARGEGNFCASCGAPLTRTSCPSCGADIPAGARFCTGCGVSLRAGEGGPAERIPWATLGWWAAGALMLVLILLLVFPLVNPSEGPGPGVQPVAPSAGEGAGTPPDISQMTPREAADRLFNRVMEAAENGDSGSVAMFMPMALQAYEAARPLDADGQFHVSLLQRTAGNPQAALAVAEEALEREPRHLLLLAAAASAAGETGDGARAQELWSRFLELYDQEQGEDRSGYRDHARLLPDYRAQAEGFIREPGG